MSDYLGNLVTRALSQAAIVRPQLPSLFEPSPASGQLKSELEFERKTFSGSPPVMLGAETIVPNLRSILTPQQSSLGELDPTPITHRSETPLSSTPSIPTPRQSSLDEPESPPITRRSKTPTSTPPRILAPSQSAVRESEPITPRASRPEIMVHAEEEPEPSRHGVVPGPASRRQESQSIPVRAKTNVESVTPELRKDDSDTGQGESSPRRARANEALTSVPQLSTPDSQLKSPSLVRPAVTVQKIRAVQAVVPANRTLPQFPSTPAPAPVPTINVTIGRVEIRATSQPTPPPRARPKFANVLSLEDYLRQRAKGGGR